MASTDAALTVAQLNNYAKSLLENDVRLRSVRVRGELTGFKRHSSGHLYFSLKDESALIRCVMFRSSAVSLRFSPQDGMKVVLSGSVTIYAKDGQYQFYANTMRQEGEGDLYQQFLELQKKLEAEGLFARKRSIPFLPACVGVVTSETGAALHDIVTVIRRRFPSMNILFAPAQVQGASAPETIIDAIRLLNETKKPGVLIVGRGGGSYEDLSCFNDEGVARAIYASEIPVISAVGHEVDFTIADFVSDLRAPTPSAAAELAVPVLADLLYDIDAKRERLDDIVGNAVDSAKKHIELLSSSAALAKPAVLIDKKRASLNRAADALKTSMDAAMAAGHARLGALTERLGALDPLSVLRRGYAIVTDEENRPVMSAAGVNEGQRLNISLADGSIAAKAERIETKENTETQNAEE